MIYGCIILFFKCYWMFMLFGCGFLWWLLFNLLIFVILLVVSLKLNMLKFFFILDGVIDLGMIIVLFCKC